MIVEGGLFASGVFQEEREVWRAQAGLSSRRSALRSGMLTSPQHTQSSTRPGRCGLRSNTATALSYRVSVVVEFRSLDRWAFNHTKLSCSMFQQNDTVA